MIMTSKLVIYSVFAIAVASSVNSNSDVDALYAWKTKLADPNNVLQSWDPSSVYPCFWMHVTCNSDNRITRVDVGNAGLVGPLVPELGNLTYLQYFEVYGNKLKGSIPKEIGKLSRLISLGLEQNQLTGTIPESFGNLTSLRFLRLSENRPNGLIPATLGNLKSLENIYLNSNNFTGNIPLQLLELVGWGNLKILNISYNSLFGSFQSTNSTGFAVTTIIQDPKAQN